MLEGFDYRMARWLPFQDQEACRKARAIKREDITRHPNPDFKIQIIRDRDFTFRLMNDIFGRIKQVGGRGAAAGHHSAAAGAALRLGGAAL